MARRLIFEPHVPEDLITAVVRYDKISPALANRFREQVNQRLDDIASRPESFPMDVAPIRFARLERFPYLIFFVVKPEFVSIIAILHGAADPSTWRRRAQD